MAQVVRKARTLLAVFYSVMTEYRAELFLWCLSGIQPFIMMGVWHEIGKQAGVDLPMLPEDMARYFIAAFLIRQLTVVWVIWDFEWHVSQGRLSPYLLQPMDPGWRFFTAHLSEQVARLPFGIILIAIFFVLYPGALWLPSIKGAVVGVLAIYMAFVLRYLMQYCLAMAAFWVERAAAMEQVMFLPYLFLSGMIAPLTFFSDGLRAVLFWTPFPYMLDFPAMLLIGRPPAVPIAQGFAVLSAWIVALFLLQRFLWNRGIRHYSAMGA